jgi:hypothetical protein
VAEHGISIPASFAACQIVVPSGTVTSRPSMVRLTVRISVGRESRWPLCLSLSSMPQTQRSEREVVELPSLSRPVGPARGVVVRLDHASRRSRVSAARRPERPRALVEEAVGQPSSARVQPSRALNARLASTIRRRGRLELLAVDVPAG